MDVSNNHMTTIPTQIGMLAALANLEDSDYSQSILFTSFRDVSTNSLSNLPTEMGALTSLQSLWDIMGPLCMTVFIRFV